MKNAQSYDKRMENFPLLISYPRSGSNWVNCILELYLDRPRLRAGPVTFIKNRDNRRDYLWFHDHDIFSDLKVAHNNIIYLYRNPDDVIFSLLMAEYQKVSNKLVNKQIKLLKNHYEKYLLSKNKSTIFIRYEDLKKGINSSDFPKVIKYLNNKDKFSELTLQKAINIVTKDKVIKKEIDKRYFSKILLDSSYKNKRMMFKKEYKDKIYNELISENLKVFFNEICD